MPEGRRVGLEAFLATRDNIYIARQRHISTRGGSENWWDKTYDAGSIEEVIVQGNGGGGNYSGLSGTGGYGTAWWWFGGNYGGTVPDPGSSSGGGGGARKPRTQKRQTSRSLCRQRRRTLFIC